MGTEDFQRVTETRQNINKQQALRRARAKARASLTALAMMLVLALSIFLGHRYLGGDVYNPEKGFGYALGLTGGILILLAYGYSFAKYLPILRNRGRAIHSLKLHIVFAVAGTFFALFHSTFHIGSLNSGVVYYSLVLVFISGVIGRYLYSRLHEGVGKASLNQRLFYIWRHAHQPLLVLLFISGVIHVIAVHIY